MTAVGVLAGTNSAYQPDTSKPGTPASDTVGTSGSSTERFDEVTASARNWPPLMSGITAPVLLNITSTRPGMRSLSAGPAPRYGMCWSFSPVILLNSSPDRCTEVPCPDDA